MFFCRHCLNFPGSACWMKLQNSAIDCCAVRKTERSRMSRTTRRKDSASLWCGGAIELHCCTPVSHWRQQRPTTAHCSTCLARLRVRRLPTDLVRYSGTRFGYMVGCACDSMCTILSTFTKNTFGRGVCGNWFVNFMVWWLFCRCCLAFLFQREHSTHAHARCLYVPASIPR